MASIKEFADNATILNNKELQDYENALNTLKTWEIFESNFGHGNSLALLRSIISNEITTRAYKAL